MKLYIVLSDEIPVGLAINSAAHASLIAHLKFKDYASYDFWLHNSFKKVTCKAPIETIHNILGNVEFCCPIHEGQKLVGVVLCPRDAWPSIVKSLKLYK